MNSMTGFGRGDASNGDATVIVEMKSVNNRFRDLRFAIHYMYTHDSEVRGNYSTRNNSAWALMYSDRLVVTGHPSTPGYNDPAYPLQGRVSRAPAT